jgi:hypothetical protein
MGLQLPYQVGFYLLDQEKQELVDPEIKEMAHL